MADRPSPEPQRQPASYSPPPQHRPAWISGDRGSRPGGTVPPADKRWSGQPGELGSGAPPPRRDRGGVALAMALVAALFASGATYALLLAGGQLDRQVIISEPLGQQTGTGARSNPDIVRVVEENAVTAAVDTVSPAVVTITPRGRDGGVVFDEGVGSGVIYDPDGWVVTNRHVVCNAVSLSIQLANGRHFEGEIRSASTP